MAVSPGLGEAVASSCPMRAIPSILGTLAIVLSEERVISRFPDCWLLIRAGQHP